MGNVKGQFTLDKPLTVAHKAYLDRFAWIRHMKRNEKMLGFSFPDPLREAVGLPVGKQGMYSVGVSQEGYRGQKSDTTVTDYNQQPDDMPDLWCVWVPTEDGMGIEWGEFDDISTDGGAWLEFLIEHFLKRWGYTLHGEVAYAGEDVAHRGTIVVKDNAVTVNKWRRNPAIPLCDECGFSYDVREPHQH